MHCCEIFSSWKVGAYPAGGRTFSCLRPPGWIAVVRLTFSCLFSACLLGSFRRGLSCCAAGPLFRGAACLDFCVKPKGARPTYVWERVALSPRALLLGCDLSCWWLFVDVCCVSFRLLFLLVLLRIRPGFLGRAVWRWPSGSQLRRPKQAGVFLPCSFVLSFPYFFLAEKAVVFSLFFDRGFIFGTLLRRSLVVIRNFILH